jgi:hypothetical protein
MEGGPNRIEKPAVANPESAPGVKLTQGLYALDMLSIREYKNQYHSCGCLHKSYNLFFL